MTNDIHTAMQTWWNTVSFEGKELYTLTEKGELILQPVDDIPARQIAILTEQDANTILDELKEKYIEAAAKLKELEIEWVATEDKLKLAHKAEKLKEYIYHLQAAGPLNLLYTIINDLTHASQQLSEDNYRQKLKITEAIEALAETNNWKEATQTFKDIGEQWKKIGYLDKKRNDELWGRVEAAKNKFFERKRSYQRENENELLQNLDLKMELAEKAEGLANSEKWKETTEIFKQLMEQWKSIGHTIPEKNEELWKRFITAKNTFFDKKRAHTEHIHHELDANLVAKKLLVEKAEMLKDSTDWVATTQAFADIMEEWKNSGRAVAEKADELWNRMKAAREHFFSSKNHHFESIRENLQANYIKKQELLQRAEALQNSTHWHDATGEMNELMDEWKKTGPVPREHSNKIWEAFLNARKQFFKRKDENRERRKEHADRKKHAHEHQMNDLLRNLAKEIKEEEERIEDFKNGLLNISPGHKEKELRAHLHNLIAEGEEKIKRKQAKVEEVKKQLEQTNTNQNNDTPKKSTEQPK